MVSTGHNPDAHAPLPSSQHPGGRQRPRRHEIGLVIRAREALAGRIGLGDTSAAAEVASWALGTENFLPLAFVALPMPVIRAVLRRPRAHDPRVTFLASYVGKADSNAVLERRWKAALGALEVFRVADIYRLASRTHARTPLKTSLRASKRARLEAWLRGQ